jgi:hypothetical protein
MVLFIISIILSTLILILCIVQAFQTRCKSIPTITVQHNEPFLNSLSANNTSVNT